MTNKISNRWLRTRKAIKRVAARLGVAPKDTLFTDVSEFQRSVYTNAYPYQFASFRANDGTYHDKKFAANLAWAKAAATSGRITGFIVYCVYRTNWQETAATLKSMVGTPHPKMAVMIDVESWSGAIKGNQSAGINGLREELIAWLGGNRKRVIGYGNAGDLAGLWPSRGDAQIVLANYSSNPATPKHIAHQYTSSATVAPFGKPVDLNSADGLTPAAFATALGLVTPVPPKPPAPPTPPFVPYNPTLEHDVMFIRFEDAPKNPGAVYMTDGSTLTWLTLPDFDGLGRPPVHVLSCKSSTLYKLPIALGTTDPRK